MDLDNQVKNFFQGRILSGAGKVGRRFRKRSRTYKGEIKVKIIGFFRYDGIELPLCPGRRAEEKTLCTEESIQRFPRGKARTAELDRLWFLKLQELQDQGYGKEIPPEVFTLERLLNRFREERLKKMKDPSFGQRLDYWQEKLGDKPIEWMRDGRSLWPSEIIKHREKLSKRLNRYGERISPATVNRYLECLSIAFSYAQTLGWTDINPMKRPEMKFSIQNDRVRYLGQFDEGDSEGEKERLIRAIRESESPDLWEGFLFSIYTGCRQGEMYKLDWKNVNVKSGVIRFVDRKNEEDIEVDVSGSVQVMQILRERKIRSTTEKVFPVNFTKTAWNNARRKAGLGPEQGRQTFRWHDLRHTFASVLRQNGVPLEDIQRGLGHKDPKSTRRYSHSDSSVTKRNVSIVSDVLNIG